MNSLFRIVVVVLALGLLGGASYLSWFGVGLVSNDLHTTSVRTGSNGGAYIGGTRIK